MPSTEFRGAQKQKPVAALHFVVLADWPDRTGRLDWNRLSLADDFVFVPGGRGLPGRAHLPRRTDRCVGVELVASRSIIQIRI